MPLFKKHKVEPAPPAPPTAAANVAAALGVTKDYRDRWGEEAFRALSSVAFAEADADKSGVMELVNQGNAIQGTDRFIDDEVAEVLQKYDADARARLARTNGIRCSVIYSTARSPSSRRPRRNQRKPRVVATRVATRIP